MADDPFLTSSGAPTARDATIEGGGPLAAAGSTALDHAPVAGMLEDSGGRLRLTVRTRGPLPRSGWIRTEPDPEEALTPLRPASAPDARGWTAWVGTVPTATHEAVTQWLQSLEYQASEAQREVRYLTAQGVTRLAFLDAILHRLDEQQWQHKADAGWSAYDVEVYGNRWCSLQLITASEAAGEGQYRLKCRLTTVSSLLAKLTLWSMLSLAAMLIIVLAGEIPWVWLSALLLPAFALFLDKQQKNLRRLVALFLDDIARRQKLVKLDEADQPLAGWVHPSDQTTTTSEAEPQPAQPAVAS